MHRPGKEWPLNLFLRLAGCAHVHMEAEIEVWKSQPPAGPSLQPWCAASSAYDQCAQVITAKQFPFLKKPRVLPCYLASGLPRGRNWVSGRLETTMVGLLLSLGDKISQPWLPWHIMAFKMMQHHVWQCHMHKAETVHVSGDMLLLYTWLLSPWCRTTDGWRHPWRCSTISPWYEVSSIFWSSDHKELIWGTGMRQSLNQ